VSPGDHIGYEITIANVGQGDATAVVLDDPAPDHTAIVAGSVTTSHGTVLSESPLEVEIGALAPQETATVTFEVTIAAPFPTDVLEVANQATVASTELDPIPSDDPATEPVGDVTATAVFITPEVSVSDATVSEGDPDPLAAVFEVTLSEPGNRPVTVDYETVAVTATAGDDYDDVAGTLVFPIDSVTETIAVPIHDDAILESDETFRVELSAPVNTEIARGTAVGTILDDEICAGPNLLRNPGAEQRPVDGELPGWTAVSSDWQQRFAEPEPAAGQASFWAGGGELAELLQDVDVAAYQARIGGGGQIFAFAGSLRTADEVPPDVARIVVEYRDAANAVELERFDSGEIASPFDWHLVTDVRAAPVGTGWIRVRLIGARFTEGGNDAYFDDLSLRSLRTPTLAIDDATAYEGPGDHASDALFTAALSCPFEYPVSAAYATADGTAVAGDDYLATAGSFTLPVGETSEAIAVTVLSDDEDEPHETFFVELSGLSAEGGPVLLDSLGVGTIRNDDFCALGHGYWKNHTEAWPVDELEIGGIWYGADQLLEHLRYNGSDAASKLARHLVATKLNLAMGSDPVILPVVEEADAFLEIFPPGSNPRGSDRQLANAIKDDLDDYNDGKCD
ncbi:MAG: DUF11 domain-containing protein, partial [bacterium]|nr:DUF11 domain-containing protein [bacterium]